MGGWYAGNQHNSRDSKNILLENEKYMLKEGAVPWTYNACKYLELLCHSCDSSEGEVSVLFSFPTLHRSNLSSSYRLRYFSCGVLGYL